MALIQLKSPGFSQLNTAPSQQPFLYAYLDDLFCPGHRDVVCLLNVPETALFSGLHQLLDLRGLP
jgi:hypothetical protein